MKSIRIFDKEFNMLGEIDKYESFNIKRRFYTLSEFEFKINSSNINSDKLIKNNIIVIGKYYNKSGIILHREYDKEKDKDIVTIRGVTLQGLVNRRIIVPDVGQSFENCTGKQETIMKHFVNKNCVNPVNIKRKIPNFIIATDKLKGINDSWRSSYENVSDKLKEIGEYSNLGWNVILDKDNKKYVFDILEGKDLTVNQSKNPPVIFRSDFNNILTAKYIESIIKHKNVIYSGTREDSTKLVLSVGDTEGFERMEMFNSINSDDSSEITKDGQVKLKENEEIKTFELEVNPNKNFIYEKDYNLGDIVTIQYRKLGITMDSRIIEIEETYNKVGMNLKITFGTSIPDFISRIKILEKKVI